DQSIQGAHAFLVIAAYERWLGGSLWDRLAGLGARLVRFLFPTIPRLQSLGFLEDAANRQRMVAILRLLGLFDRPATSGALKALCKKPVIPGLTESLVDIAEENWRLAVLSLVELGLVSEQDGALDTHPLVRAWFAKSLREETDEHTKRVSTKNTKRHKKKIEYLFSALRAFREQGIFRGSNSPWREGHRRLYEYLTTTTLYQPDTLEALQPLYQAVAHGCEAGLRKKAYSDVYRGRILRGTGLDGFYSRRKLGAIGADLEAVACFFDRPWEIVSPNLSSIAQAWLLNEAASSLNALGRFREALEPMRVVTRMTAEHKDWKNAAISAGNLSELELTLGAVDDAVRTAGQSVAFADRSGDAFWTIANCVKHADALHQSGSLRESLRLFQASEILQAENQPEYPRLYSVRGFCYCELLLAQSEWAAWRLFNASLQFNRKTKINRKDAEGTEIDARIAECDHVIERATRTLEWMERAQASVLTIALEHLTLARAGLYRRLFVDAFLKRRLDAGAPRDAGAGSAAFQAALFSEQQADIQQHLAAAVDGLRKAGQMQYLPSALLTRAWHRALTGDGEGAWMDLDEAMEITARGPMPLFDADILLTRVRLFGIGNDESRTTDLESGAGNTYPWGSARSDLAAARALVKKHGYHRRDGELADVEEMFGA
ncbi:MAG: hypothetical protein HKP13_09175, partial [Gammaproteobacteria bacterium]|nr:hypothetical protein [Gammaproteobacteria bacterium]